MLPVLAVTVLLWVSSAQALVCMTCDWARSHQECDKNGFIRKCLTNEMKCAIEERKLNYGPDLLVFKSCKQPHACRNNFIQNQRPAWWPTQCNPHYPNSVCRCCCDTDSCNRGALGCDRKASAAMLNCNPPLEAPLNGSVNCTDRNLIGSVCQFDCARSFVLSEAKASICEKNGEWSIPPPLCLPIFCTPIFFYVENGFVQCSAGNDPNSVCSFGCNEGYKLAGNATSTCLYNNDHTNAKWSDLLPTCYPIDCPEQGNMKNGRISCSRKNFYQSICEFTCKSDEYIRHPPEVISNTCLVSGLWSEPKPCCIKPCPPHAVFDLVMALDSSSSVGREGWNMTLSFVKAFANLYDLNVLNFALFRYNSLVDSASEIRFDSGFEPPRLLQEIGNIPYDGTGTNTGKALTYALDVMLSMSRGRRRGAKAVFVVVTDGKSQDDVTIPARNLRNAGIETFAVGVTPLDEKLDFDELRIIAGDLKRVSIAEDGYIGLDVDFAKELSKEVCGNPCSQPDIEDLNLF